MSLEESGLPDVARVTDARSLRALGHPVRLALLEVLTLHGPLTATQAGELIDETPTTCSFHLRQLAKYGFVEEAGGGKGRARPWRRRHLGFTVKQVDGDHDFTLAWQHLDRVLLQRYWARLTRWTDSAPSYPKEWQQASDASEYAFYATPEELAELTAEYRAVLRRYFDRWKDRYDNHSARPADARPVEVLTFAYPAEFPATGKG